MDEVLGDILQGLDLTLITAALDKGFVELTVVSNCSIGISVAALVSELVVRVTKDCHVLALELRVESVVDRLEDVNGILASDGIYLKVVAFSL